MTNISAHYLDLLKTKVVEQAGLNRMTAADCRVLSFLIIQQTRQRLSETTLKRLYGFAYAKFQPSVYTLDALAQYCGFAGWDDWQDQAHEPPVKNGQVTWEHLRQNATRVSNNTIQTLRNRSGIPYHYTINRDCIEAHMEDFLESGSIATVLLAPAGYGKSVSICRWVELQISKPQNDNIFLFFSSTALASNVLSGRNLRDWLQGLLGYGDVAGIAPLDSIIDRSKGRFWVVIDGFDEHYFRPEQFQLVLSQIGDTFARYQELDYLRLVLTMRSSTWANYRHEMVNAGSNWFTGFKMAVDGTNIPPFDFGEIKKLATRINPDLVHSVCPTVLEQFGQPSYFDGYYRQHRANFSFENIDETTLYEINSLFILNHIYLGKYAQEKVRLISKIINLLIASDIGYYADKRMLGTLNAAEESALKELLSSGYLREVNESRTHVFRIALNFGSNYFLSHAIARTWLSDNNEQFDRELIYRIGGSELESKLRLSVVKWCILHAVKTGQQNGLDHLFELGLPAPDRLALVNFLGDVFRKEFEQIGSNESSGLYLTRNFSPQLFEYFFGLELVSPDYRRSLDALLLFKLSEEQQVFVYTAIGVVSLINLDLAGLDSCLSKLHGISATTYDQLPLNPATCLNAFLGYFRYGIVDRAVLVMLTRFMTEPISDLKSGAGPATDMLFLLGAYTGYLFNSPRKLLRLVGKLDRYKAQSHEEPEGYYDFFIGVLRADVAFKIGEANKLVEIYDKLSHLRRIECDIFTPFMEILHAGLKIKMLVKTRQENLISCEIRHVEAIVSESGSKISKLYILSLLLKNQAFLENNPQFKKQIYHDITRITRENAILRENFLVI